MNIKELQSYVEEFSNSRGFNNNTIETRTMYLMTEIGELTKEVLKVSFKKNNELALETKTSIGLEMFDVFWNLCDLANILDIDLEEAFNEKININKDRQWK